MKEICRVQSITEASRVQDYQRVEIIIEVSRLDFVYPTLYDNSLYSQVKSDNY